MGKDASIRHQHPKDPLKVVQANLVLVLFFLATPNQYHGLRFTAILNSVSRVFAPYQFRSFTVLFGVRSAWKTQLSIYRLYIYTYIAIYRGATFTMTKRHLHDVTCIYPHCCASVIDCEDLDVASDDPPCMQIYQPGHACMHVVVARLGRSRRPGGIRPQNHICMFVFYINLLMYYEYILKFTYIYICTFVNVYLYMYFLYGI